MSNKELLAKVGIKDASFGFLTVAELIKLGVIDKPLDGNHGETHPKGEDFVAFGVPFVMASDINNGAVDYSNCKFITSNQADNLRKGFARNGDVLLTHKATIGRTAIVKYDQHPFIMLTPQVTYYRIKDPRKLNNKYLLYYFQSSFFQSTLKLWAGSGATRAYLGITGQQKLPIVLPPLEKQRKIAAILSAYDDLIENNKRRIALLEQMAEEIYREWFVRMRFPGHEKTKFEKGIPEGWEVKRISEVVNFLGGYSFKSRAYSSTGKYGVVTIKNAQDGFFIPECTDYIEDIPQKMKKHCHLEAGDLLMSLTGNVGRVCHVYGNNLLLNQRVAKLMPKLPNSSQFIFCTFNNKSMVQLIENLSLGSTAQMNLSPILLGKQKIVVPAKALVAEFEDMSLPMFNAKMILLQQNMLLQKTRDRLLSRLISGKLSVEDLDIHFPPSMQEDVENLEQERAYA